MRTALLLTALILSGALLVSCGSKFDNTNWECKYDYKEFQDHMTGNNVLEFLPGSKVRGTFSNFGPLPPSVYIYDYTVEGDKITCTHADVDTRVFSYKDGKLHSEDGHCVYVKKEAVKQDATQAK
jgi:major membrane immunogen (membrane-anchored lipoprotein)